MSEKQDVVEVLRPLPHARDVQDYLIVLSAAITGKKKPPADYIHNLNNPSDIFIDHRDIEKVVSLIQEIFTEKGYRTPWQLEDDLIQKIQPGIPAKAITLANHYAASMLIPDTMAAYLQKPCVPLTMGFGALYNKTTGKPVSVIEIDFSNMRGTNNHNARLLSAAKDVSPDEVVAEAESMTDQVAFIIAQTIKQKCLAPLREEGNLKIIGLRTGGDELRLVIPDLDIDRAIGMIPDIHQTIETITAKVGNHDHPHTKKDHNFRGFGAAAAAFSLEPVGDSVFRECIQEADLAIKKTKVTIGKDRLNNPHFCELKPPYSTDDELYTDKKKSSAHLNEVQRTISAIKGNLVADMSDMESPSDVVSPEDIADILQPTHFLTPYLIQQGFRRCLYNDLDKNGLSLNPEQKRLLGIKATKFPTMDYATGTLSDRDFSAMAGAALKVNDNLNALAATNVPPIILGVSFHNMAGLNDSRGHEGTNEILRRLVHKILIPALEKEGIAKENMVLAHVGGGEFRAIIQPVISDTDGYQRIIDPQLPKARQWINTETEKLSKAEFQNVLNPRHELRPYENGITASIVTGPYQEKKSSSPGLWRGGAVTAYIGNLLKKAIEEKRSRYTVQDCNTPHCTL